MTKTELTERAVKLVGAHPYVTAALICLAAHTMTFGSIGNIPGCALMIETIGVFCALSLAGWLVLRRKPNSKLMYAGYEVFVIALCVSGAKLYRISEHKGLWHFFGGCVAALLLYLLADRKQCKDQINAFLILAAGFFLKLYYVLGTGCYQRQHDVGSFDWEEGHAAYMEYLFLNHHLSDFDIRTHAQFYHPPLHHTIGAVWLWFNETLMGIPRDPTRESVQMLTLFYSMCIMITSYKILRHFKLSGKSLYIPLILISLHPTFVVFSGSINNDVLTTALMLASVLCTLQWYENPTCKSIAKIALFVGLGMMTKLSAALVAPPIAVIFVYAFFRNKKEKIPMFLKQYGVFSLICFPLGLWFGTRNYLRWGVPFTYIYRISEDATQNLRDQSFVSRIFDFSPHQLSSVYEQWLTIDEAGVRHGYNEYNPIITVMKNAMFSEYINETCFPDGSFVNVVSCILFWLNVAIAAAALAAMIVICIRKTNIPKMSLLFPAMFYALMLVSFYKTAADFAFTCTMNIRYISPTIIIGCLFLGLALQRIGAKETTGRTLAVNLTGAAALVFGLCSCVVYLAVCYTS